MSNGGTIFLDEIGELPLSTQAKLLRVLETGEFIRVGSSKVQKTNVRVIAATNVDLPIAVKNGKFREDLYYGQHDTIRYRRYGREKKIFPCYSENSLPTSQRNTGCPDQINRGCRPGYWKLIVGRVTCGN